jgi:hypothetical protein
MFLVACRSVGKAAVVQLFFCTFEFTVGVSELELLLGGEREPEGVDEGVIDGDSEADVVDVSDGVRENQLALRLWNRLELSSPKLRSWESSHLQMKNVPLLWGRECTTRVRMSIEVEIT